MLIGLIGLMRNSSVLWTFGSSFRFRHYYASTQRFYSLFFTPILHSLTTILLGSLRRSIFFPVAVLIVGSSTYLSHYLSSPIE
jgi:hypothetical protein